MANLESILNTLDIDKDDWVLEIGGGPNPFVRSDVLTDKYLENNSHRSGKLVFDRPLVVCDAHYLPFVEKSFDYAICSQVLEHLEDPELFFEEISRVSKKGYIETPNEIRERLFGWPFHKWIVDKDEKWLVIRKNNVDQPFGVFFHKLQLENYEFAKFCTSWHDLLNVCYEWHDKISFRFAEAHEYTTPKEKVCLDVKETFSLKLSEAYRKMTLNQLPVIQQLKKKIPRKVKQLIKRSVMPPPYGYRHSYQETEEYIKTILACPICKVKVSSEENGLIVCPKCGQHFKVQNTIPFMLKYV